LQRKASRRGETLFDSVRAQLVDLSRGFGLEGQRAQVLEAYDLICRESMDFPMGMRPPDFSRINADGTPFQYSLSLGAGKPSFHFLSEAGIPGSSIADRIMLSLERIEALTSMFHADEELASVRGLIDRIAPADDPALLADPAGALWIGVAFGPEATPKLTVYVNAKWGEETAAWNRLDSFVSSFPEARSWTETRRLLAAKMRPLGMAVTLGEGSPPNGRAYLSAHGNPLSYYRELALSATDERFCEVFDNFVRTLLGENRFYPLRSVVCSYGVGTDSHADFKFELCGHCSLASDELAEAKCLEWISSISVDSSLYSLLLRTLANGPLSRKSVDLHSYMGLGLRRGEVSSTIYLKPRWSGAVA